MWQSWFLLILFQWVPLVKTNIVDARRRNRKDWGGYKGFVPPSMAYSQLGHIIMSWITKPREPNLITICYFCLCLIVPLRVMSPTQVLVSCYVGGHSTKKLIALAPAHAIPCAYELYMRTLVSITPNFHLIGWTGFGESKYRNFWTCQVGSFQPSIIGILGSPGWSYLLD